MRNFFYKLTMIPKFLKDSDVAIPKKLLIIFAIAYTISPIDIIPDPIILVGWIDDIVLLLYSWTKLSEYLEKYIPKKKNVIKFRKKDIIEDVDYEIEDKE
ncbi:DUF1232 domain-containing protein [Clostridium sp. D2Q-11]|uniref:DUF1232 domain-containing protein n=1 Tax=Anaeromonas frigoriresistens TaxID=2683708 RepID=A0A942Z581_9FIRM|nr:DUF1232 domain-containing protein [Anaeromonas frigoriresistens]MBS4537141.1 DUF1232 domain-containing protein [Anaeromonas frigoriresistens]